jgi:hypothetical protein
MAAIDNLISLHDREEQLRARSLDVIQSDAALSEHWALVAEAMTAIWAFSHDHEHSGENELALQLFGHQAVQRGRRVDQARSIGLLPEGVPPDTRCDRDVLPSGLLVDVPRGDR